MRSKVICFDETKTWVKVEGGETSATFVNRRLGLSAWVKWDGCIELFSYCNAAGGMLSDGVPPEQIRAKAREGDIEQIHLCSIADTVRALCQLRREAREHIDHYEGD